jgi:hypothetical protein
MEGTTDEAALATELTMEESWEMKKVSRGCSAVMLKVAAIFGIRVWVL